MNIDKLINDLNNFNSLLTNKNLDDKIKDTQRLKELNSAINSLKKSLSEVIKEVDSPNNSQKDTLGIPKNTDRDSLKFTKNKVKDILKMDNEYILEEYSVSDLKDMYMVLYGIKPLSSYGKKEIISSIRSYLFDERRALAFKP